MPHLRDLLKKKEKIDSHVDEQPAPLPQANEFTFLRTDTNTEEYIKPPSFIDSDRDRSAAAEPKSPSPSRRSFGRFRKGSSPSVKELSSPEKDKKRFSERLHLHRDRSASTSSVNLPSDLPDLGDTYTDSADRQETEAKWEERATMLASKSPIIPANQLSGELDNLNLGSPAAHSPARPRSVNDPDSDLDIQRAIELHESGVPGELEQATEMFRRLAESGNVLSQVLYGLSLRHGWGCQPDPAKAISYLSAAASNSATIESDALKSGMKKGGAAKGELVLAIFELANCFRNGWGVPVDKAAARQYYETAANLGDTDAMNEAAWCYLEGFGGKKDKVSRAPSTARASYTCNHPLGRT
jgi:TPR repeat protein